MKDDIVVWPVVFLKYLKQHTSQRGRIHIHKQQNPYKIKKNHQFLVSCDNARIFSRGF